MPSASSSPLRRRSSPIMPLWTTAKSPCSERCGWAFVSVGAPWVAQRGVGDAAFPRERGRRSKSSPRGSRRSRSPLPSRCAPRRARRRRRCHSRGTRGGAARRAASARGSSLLCNLRFRTGSVPFLPAERGAQERGTAVGPGRPALEFGVILHAHVERGGPLSRRPRRACRPASSRRR